MGNHWNNPEIYAKFIKNLRNLNVKHCFLFITSDIKKLKEIFRQHGIEPKEYIAISTNLQDVPKYLSAAEFGLNLMDTLDIRMSIKTAEYLSMGLPVITNSNVLGAKEVVERYNVGLVLEDLENINLREIESIIQKRDLLSLKCRKVACMRFSTAEVAKQYVQIYNILKKAKNETV